MLTYTFSRREKVLLLVLALVVVGIAWFAIVYQGSTTRISEIENQMEINSLEIDVDQERVGQMASMQKSVDQHKAAGDKPIIMPDYNNMRPLMAELNNIMKAADTFTLTFDQVNISDETDVVSRGVRVDFSCGSYNEAEGLVKSLANGKYPCQIDSVSINDSTIGGSRAATVSSSVHVTFFEKNVKKTAEDASKSAASASAGAA